MIEITMKKTSSYAPLCLLFFVMICTTACSSQAGSNTSGSGNAAPKTGAQIGEYVVGAFEDKKGNLWFGTMTEGVARYDQKAFTYFSVKDGLPDNTVAVMTEDKAGNLWLATHAGLSKYNADLPNEQGKMFTNFTKKDGLCDDRVSDILIDKAGNMWIGTWAGVCRYHPSADQTGRGTFSNFPLPIPDIEVPVYQATANWVTEIIEDRQGNIWFGRSGYGASKYDPVSGKFTQFTKKDGLPSNCVQAIHEDRQGNIWFGCRVAERDHPDAAQRTGDGGLARYDPSAADSTNSLTTLRPGGQTFTQYPEQEGLSKNDIYTIYEDKAGNIWIGATGFGVYRYDGKSFRIYKETDRMDLTAGFGLQSMLEDRNGKLWLGFSGGLFRFKDSAIINVTQDGPWE